MIDAGFGNVKISQRRYLGSKTKLLGFIEEILQQEKVKYDSFADIFSGTGVVAAAYHEKADIIVNDILESNHISYQAFFGKQRIRKKWLEDRLRHYNLIEIDSLKENYFSENFSETYYSHANSKLIGYIRDDIETMYSNDELNDRERAYLITVLIYGMDRIANTVGHYDAYRKLTEVPYKKLILRGLDVSKSKRQTKIFRMDANELVKRISADVVYIDPPYNSRQYSDSYHLLENIAEWKKDEVFGVAKKINRDHLKSKYSLKSAGYAFSELIDNLKTNYILVSYNDMGTNGDPRSQSRISDHEIISALERRGKVKIYEKDFNQFTTGKSLNKDLKERIFFCKLNQSISKKPASINTRKNLHDRAFIKSPLNYTGGKHKLLPQITEYFPKDIETFYDIFCGAANVGINAESKNIICVDQNKAVVELLNLLKNVNFEELNNQIINVIEKYGLSQSYVHSYEKYSADSSKGLGEYNKEKYKQLRLAYNTSSKSKNKTLLLLVLILFGFNNQIRFNSKGEFNLPVGKRDYNGSSRKNIANFNAITNEKNIEFRVDDFRNIAKYSFGKNDFVYLDPPYLLGLASYNENKGWAENDERDLYKLLDTLDKLGVKFALSNVTVHKGEENIILKEWVARCGYKVNKISHHYNNSNYQSKAKESMTQEVLITNY